ncbi:MAG TPA: hypothetical protein VK092_07695, partial [Deinococcales bacterium]|nr:hypothetical protein [Deinococcales bacterium]
LFVADTNNHTIRIADPETGSVESVQLHDPDALLTAAHNASDAAFDEVLDLPAATLHSGSPEVVFSLDVPAGYVANHLAPLTGSFSTETGAAAVTAPDVRVSEPDYPLELTVPLSLDGPGEDVLTADVTVYYCEEEARQVCLISQVRFRLPLVFSDGGDATERHEVDWQAPALP